MPKISLNSKQNQVVNTTKGHLLVLAGAGTGKTRALTQRYVHLLDSGVDSKNILAVTFTRKAAEEMRNRIFAATGTHPEGPICTFHSFCSFLLRTDGHAINVRSNFKIHDEQRMFKDIQSAIQKTGHSANHIRIEIAAAKIKCYKNRIFRAAYIKCKTASDTGTLNWYANRSLNDPSRPWEEHMFWHYMKIQQNSNSMDYEDLINLGIELLNVDPVRQKWQDQFKYIMVDEYQDINPEQYDLVSKISGQHENIMVVGDPNQTIYTFQGSDIIRIITFSQDHGNCPVIEMDLNYRSSQSILDAANELIKYNFIQSGIELRSVTGEPDARPLYYHALSDFEEMTWIEETIRFLLEPVEVEVDESELEPDCSDWISQTSQMSVYDLPDHDRIGAYMDDPDEEGSYQRDLLDHVRSCYDEEVSLMERPVVYENPYDYSDIAILCKDNVTCRDYEKYLNDHDIPAAIISNTKFFELEIIRVAIGYLAMVYDPHNDKAFDLTVNNPARQIGKDAVKTIKDFAQKNNISRFEALEHVCLKMRARIRAQNYIRIIKEFNARYMHMSLSDLTAELLDAVKLDSASRPGVTTRDLDDLALFKSLVYDFEISAGAHVTLRDLLDHFDTHKESDYIGNKVRISTIHSAKGLEFPVVFVPRMIQGVFPYKKSLSGRALEEERRVLYVAITRAKELLYLSDYETVSGSPSQFIFELGDTIEHKRAIPGHLIQTPVKPNKVYTPADILPVGTRVNHKRDGDGTITHIGYGTYEILFDNLQKTRTRAFDSVTKLSPSGSSAAKTSSAGTTTRFMFTAGDFMRTMEPVSEIERNGSDDIRPALLPEDRLQEVQPEDTVSSEYPMDHINPLLLNTEPSQNVLNLIKEGVSMNEVEAAQIAEAYPF